MPDVDGLELLRHVRGDDNLANVPVVSAFSFFAWASSFAAAYGQCHCSHDYDTPVYRSGADSRGCLTPAEKTGERRGVRREKKREGGRERERKREREHTRALVQHSSNALDAC